MAEPVTSAVVRLETFVELVRESTDVRTMSVHARLDAVLSDGAHVVLLDDRGWSASGPADLWSRASAAETERTARVVVGPDEPVDGRSYETAADSYRELLAWVLRNHGVEAEGPDLAGLPHDVVLGDRLRARLSR